jgi:hypothetical protein
MVCPLRRGDRDALGMLRGKLVVRTITELGEIKRHDVILAVDAASERYEP